MKSSKAGLSCDLVGQRVEIADLKNYEPARGVLRAVWPDNKGDLRCIMEEDGSGKLVEHYVQALRTVK